MMKKLLLASLVYVLLISPLTTHAYSFIDKLKQLKSDTTHLRGQLKGEALTDAVLTIKLSASNPAAQIVAPGANNVKIVEYDVTASSGGTLDRFLTSYSQYQPSGQPPQPQATSDIKIYIDGVPLSTDATEYKTAHTFAAGQTKKVALYVDVLPTASLGIQFFGSVTGVASTSTPGITTTWTGLTAGNLFTVGTPVNSCVIESFTANPTSVRSGGYSTLTWVTRGCKHATLNTSGGYDELSGSKVVGPLTETTSYTLNATGGYPFEPSAAGVTVTVNTRFPPIVLNLDTTPRIEYWRGKVNQHIDKRGVWLTDPDGTSGANIDKLTYCKKWYPETTAIKDYKMETISGWRNAGNTGGPFTETFMSTACVKGEVPILTPSITVLSPNGGESYEVGQQIKITWTTVNIPADAMMSIWLSAGDTVWTSNEVPNSGSFVYDTSSLSPGTNYKVTIKLGNVFITPDIRDSSDNTFTIKNSSTTTSCPTNGTPSISVLSPNGGEVYEAGQQITVMWKTCNISANAKIAFNLVADPNYDDTAYLFNTENGSEITTNDGKEMLTLPLFIQNMSKWKYGKYYKIRVLVTEEGAINTYYQDNSDNSFTINSPQTISCPTNGNPSIKVLSPNGGEVYQPGQQVTVKWESCNYGPNSKVMIDLRKGITKFNLLPYPASSNYANSWFPNVGEAKVQLPVTSAPYYDTFKTGNDFVIELFPSATGLPQDVTSVYDQSDNMFTINNFIAGALCPNGMTLASNCTTAPRSTDPIPRSTETDITNNTSEDRMATTPTIYIPSNRTLRVGVKGEDVKSLQSYFGIKTDGVYGKGTAAKVKEWQREKGLKADGLFGKKSQLILSSEGEQ